MLLVKGIQNLEIKILLFHIKKYSFSDKEPWHTPHTLLTHPSYTPHKPLTHPSHTPHTPIIHPSHTPHTPIIHPSHTPHTPFTPIMHDQSRLIISNFIYSSLNVVLFANSFPWINCTPGIRSKVKQMMIIVQSETETNKQHKHQLCNKLRSK